MDRITEVRVLAGHRVRVRLTDGTQRELDLTGYLHGPIFEAIRRDRSAFRQVRVDPALGTLVWPNGADICPDVLLQGRKPAAARRTTRPSSRAKR